MAAGQKRRVGTVAIVVAVLLGLASPSLAADEPDLIFKRSTVFKWLTPNDKLATYGLDDPEVDGVACHFTVPERGGLKGWLGVAEEVSDISLACRQIGPIRFKQKFSQGEDMFRERRSLPSQVCPPGRPTSPTSSSSARRSSSGSRPTTSSRPTASMIPRWRASPDTSPCRRRAA